MSRIKKMNAIMRTPDLGFYIEQYNRKKQNIEAELAAFEEAEQALKYACCIGNTSIGDIGCNRNVNVHQMERALLKSAWSHIFNSYPIFEATMTAKDRDEFQRSLEIEPPAFTFETLKATFGKYVINPRFHILRGLAEAFCALDSAYKSHSKVKIGVNGLPKKMIFNHFFKEYGGINRHISERMLDAVNALRTIQNLKQLDYFSDISLILEYSCIEEIKEELDHLNIEIKDDKVWLDGLHFKRFKNGNLHVCFSDETCKVINWALAEFYGDVLPDVEPENTKKQASTEVCKDLQFYATPKKVAKILIDRAGLCPGDKVLEPSCGEGALLEAMAGHGVKALGIEINAERWKTTKAKGFSALQTNFLTLNAPDQFDKVVLNPPFYGKHYLKHIHKAVDCCKIGGTVAAILPASAWYDHKQLPDGGNWYDLPPASFADSGTNVPTGIWILRKLDK
jgi:2-polyprenyl-3-methyl-5-hydroxy-6-metoxy-1,4-benzoquinol methylase